MNRTSPHFFCRFQSVSFKMKEGSQRRMIEEEVGNHIRERMGRGLAGQNACDSEEEGEMMPVLNCRRGSSRSHARGWGGATVFVMALLIGASLPRGVQGKVLTSRIDTTLR